ncbi:TonB family protein [Mesorhizobium sp. KR1-2]|uniref:energy transducer TonB family protein n=1 Tax=Mesorhizobium sp. KR1-2 TaxID=3156609 RepID=UPI0032B35D75
MNLFGRRPRYGPWQAARWTAITLSLLVHGAVAAWIFSASSQSNERQLEIPIEVTAAPLIDEPLVAPLPVPPEAPSVQQEAEVPASEAQQQVEAGPRSPTAAEATPPSEATADSGPTETVPATPPSEELPASQPPLTTVSPETPPTVATKPSKVKPAASQARTKTREKLAAREGSTAQQSASQHAATTPNDPRAQASYMARVASRLLSRKYYPGGAPSGSVVVNFSVSSSGKVMSRRVVRSSGSSVLDRAALNIVDKAAPFPPFPKGVTAPQLNFNVPMNFSR